MTTQQSYEQHHTSEIPNSGIQPIYLSNPHPYPITLDLFNGFDGVDSSYYHRVKSATPRLKTLAPQEEIILENALFVQLLGADVEVTDLTTATIIIYNGENTLLENGFNLSNRIKVRAIGNPVSLIWTKGDLFYNDTIYQARNICSIQFHPSTTDFYYQPLKWIKQDIYGNKVVEPIPFEKFGPHFKNNAYVLQLNREISSTDSFQLVLPPHSTLSAYLYSNEECEVCLPTTACCIEETIIEQNCFKPLLPFWLIFLLMIATAILLFFKFEQQNT